MIDFVYSMGRKKSALLSRSLPVLLKKSRVTLSGRVTLVTLLPKICNVILAALGKLKESPNRLEKIVLRAFPRPVIGGGEQPQAWLGAAVGRRRGRTADGPTGVSGRHAARDRSHWGPTADTRGGPRATKGPAWPGLLVALRRCRTPSSEREGED